MTRDNQPIDMPDRKPIPFGQRLQAAREALNLERKDVAQQLRLNEKIIFMMEKNRYSADIPVIFIRGYLRSYAKFLNIPEAELRKAIEHIKAKPASSVTSSVNTKPTMMKAPSKHYVMPVFTSLVVLTLVSMIGAWWIAENKPETLTMATKSINTMIAMAEARRTPNIPATDAPNVLPMSGPKDGIGRGPDVGTGPNIGGPGDVRGPGEVRGPADVREPAAETFHDIAQPVSVNVKPTTTRMAKNSSKHSRVIVQDDDHDESDDID